MNIDIVDKLKFQKCLIIILKEFTNIKFQLNKQNSKGKSEFLKEYHQKILLLINSHSYGFF